MSDNHNGFEPDITAFGCIFCGYMAADTAGTLGWEYPANVKYVKLPCTGKIDVRYLLAAFEQGADGVYVVACPLGNCHHVKGNSAAKSASNARRESWTKSASAANGSTCSF
jgi:coenzyme F420-reducing hydrogenase delta subunit